MNRLSLHKFNSKVFCFATSVLALLLSNASGASAADTIQIKDTNYAIPSGAYYVAADGKENNSGKEASSPWTVAKALSKAPSGATIVFRGGTYRNIDTSIRRKLTLQPYPGEKVWIKGSVEVTGWVSESGIWRKDGWTTSFASKLSSDYINPNYPMAGYLDMVFIDGMALKQVASRAEVVSGTFYVDAAADKLYIGSNPGGKTVEATAYDKAFSVGVSSTSNPSDTVIRGLGFAHYAEAGVAVGAARVTLLDNTFVWNGEQGVRLWGESNGTKAPSTDVVVRGNTLSYNGRNGLWGDSAHRMILEDNIISNNNVENFATDYDAAGVKVVKTNGLIWRRNLVEDNNSTGMWVDISSSNASIVHNTVRRNKSSGIYFEISHKAIIAGNLAYKNGVGIHVSNSSSTKLYNNTLVSNGTNIRVKDTTRNNTNATEIAAGITWITRNNVIKNNILSNPISGALLDASNCGTNEQSSLMISATNYNAYHRGSSSATLDVVKWALGKGKCTESYTSVAAFNSSIGYEAKALPVDNATTNPFFVDEAKEDFRLKTGSAAIGRAEALPSDVANATGWASGRALDLGAIQSQTVLVN